jgi:cytidylate kinase
MGSGNVNRKIKEIYGCNYYPDSVTKIYSLPAWHNRVIDKTVSELDELDVARMMRQDVFVECAVERALQFLREDPFAGELADAEFLVRMSKLDNKYLIPYKEELRELFLRAVEEKEEFEWMFEGDKEDFEKIIPIFLKKFQEMGRRISSGFE